MKSRPRKPAPRCTECAKVTQRKDLICRDCHAGRDPLPLPEGR